MDRALDPQDRRRAMWLWPSVFFCGFWVPLWLLVSPATAPEALARSHAKRALVLFFALYVIETIWVVVISSGAAVIGWLLWGLTTGGAIIVAALGVVSASRSHRTNLTDLQAQRSSWQ
jgi:hypothetical protein